MAGLPTSVLARAEALLARHNERKPRLIRRGTRSA